MNLVRRARPALPALQDTVSHASGVRGYLDALSRDTKGVMMAFVVKPDGMRFVCPHRELRKVDPLPTIIRRRR